MRFVTIGYGDEAGYQAADPGVLERAHAQDRRIAEAGHLIGVAGTPVQVRNDGGQSVVIDPGRYARSDLPIAGFAVIEADSIQAAVALLADTPCAVAGGVVEIWPVVTELSG